MEPELQQVGTPGLANLVWWPKVGKNLSDQANSYPENILRDMFQRKHCKTLPSRMVAEVDPPHLGMPSLDLPIVTPTYVSLRIRVAFHGRK